MFKVKHKGRPSGDKLYTIQDFTFDAKYGPSVEKRLSSIRSGRLPSLSMYQIGLQYTFRPCPNPYSLFVVPRRLRTNCLHDILAQGVLRSHVEKKMASTTPRFAGG